MEIVFFGLSISSAWGNGHASLLRGLFRALNELGHRIHFFEKDVPYYASHRDAVEFPFAQLHLYRDFQEVRPLAASLLARAEAAVITSYCADGAAAAELVFSSRVPRKLFYDMDTPVTLERLAKGEQIPYLPSSGLRHFDLVLSYTGGAALEQLQRNLGAPAVDTLYGWVDPEIYHPVPADDRFRSGFSYLGTYSADRHDALRELFLRPAALLPDRHFVVGGAMYSHVNTWPKNVAHFDHVAPMDHGAFYSSSPLTLNITRGAMSAMGYCPSGRLFEAAACGTAVLSDSWQGLDEFFTPGEEILIGHSAEEVTTLLKSPSVDLKAIAQRARERALDCHTAGMRARRLIELIEGGQRTEQVPVWATVEGA